MSDAVTARSKATAAAVKKAAASAVDTAPTVVIGTVAAWSSPHATVNIGSASIPRIRASAQCLASISVSTRVVVLVQGPVTLIIATL